MRYRTLAGDEHIVVTRAEIEAAKNISLTSLASSMGYTVVKKGVHYSLKEMDSVMIYDDRSWKRWSEKGIITGGTSIDFMMAFGGADTMEEAVQDILDQKVIVPVQNYSSIRKNPERKEFVLPEKNKDQRALFAYLIKTRGLSQKVIKYFLTNELLYEEAAHHNLVFVGRNPEGVAKYAGMRGTYDANGRKFQCDVAGNDKNYGVNIINKESSEIKVFEAVIDCMSYMDMTEDYTSNKLMLGMVEDNPLEQLLKDYDHIHTITFCLDNDHAGRKAIYGENGHPGLKDKYENLGYNVKVELPTVGKDFNEQLKSMGEQEQIYGRVR